MATKTSEREQLEAGIQAVGRQIFEQTRREKPSILRADWWAGKVLRWSMKDEAFRTQLLRFVDVLPSLATKEAAAGHLREYFGDAPGVLGFGLRAASWGAPFSGIAADAVRHELLSLARRFIAGSEAREVLPVLRQLWDRHTAFTLDLVGEAAVSEEEAQGYQDRYLALLELLSGQTASWSADPLLEEDAVGAIPRTNLSLKVTALYSQLDPVDFEGGTRRLVERLRPLFRRAKELRAFLNLDVEQHRFKDLTFAPFYSLMLEPELRGYPHAGIVVQAYLRQSRDDLLALIEWARKRGTPVTVRLVKGGYWDYESIVAAQEGHPSPVYLDKRETDANFERLTRLLLENYPVVRPAIGSHNIRSIAQAIAVSRSLGLPDGSLEFQVLRGMAEPLQRAMVEMGFRLREYVPFGELIPGMAYLVRRLLENTSNHSFLRQAFVEEAPLEELLAPPAPERTLDIQAQENGRPSRSRTRSKDPGPFANEPHADFAYPESRSNFSRALDKVRSKMGATYPLLTAKGAEDGEEHLVSRNPSDPAEEIGRVARAGREEVEAAIAAARAHYPKWRDTDAGERAQVLFDAAALMREERFELAALEVLEAGKPWGEADADVTEAIDFLEYYGREMLRLAPRRRLGNLPGEMNIYFYEPRGVAAVISPWNFPLAIPAGMTAAALVAGNAVILKPASPTPVLAWRLVDILRRAGAPAGAVQLLVGEGKEVGEALALHPDVQIIAFTGSREVGLRIIELAGRPYPGQRDIKRVVAEMGGKNAVIIDQDADLDAAVPGTVFSAFSYAGQKCSAASRVIVLDQIYDLFLGRLTAAAESLIVGPAENPATVVGPVISEEQRQKVLSYVGRGKMEARLITQVAVDRAGGGYFVGPAIFAEAAPDSAIAQEEIFGPVLTVFRAKDFDQALKIALGTPYALTGGLFSRSPGNIEKAIREFRVGNLYLNRSITGAMVSRQPFGGFGMSGVGSKAGGPDYLPQFMEPRSVSENTIRRGFAPLQS